MQIAVSRRISSWSKPNVRFGIFVAERRKPPGKSNIYLASNTGGLAPFRFNTLKFEIDKAPVLASKRGDWGLAAGVSVCDGLAKALLRKLLGGKGLRRSQGCQVALLRKLLLGKGLRRLADICASPCHCMTLCSGGHAHKRWSMATVEMTSAARKRNDDVMVGCREWEFFGIQRRTAANRH
jgi:hypothetical protein